MKLGHSDYNELRIKRLTYILKEVWAYSLIIYKKNENILIECLDIRQNH